jgi:hypothetical protein
MCTRNQLDTAYGQSLHCTTEALDDIKTRVGDAIRSRGSITLKDSTAILGYGRWGGAPVFDYLDSIGFHPPQWQRTYPAANDRERRTANECSNRPDHPGGA